MTDSRKYIFTSESVSEGHPDKVADLISDSILDACLEADSKARVACETLVCPSFVGNMGEITVNADIDFKKIAQETVKEIGYDNPAEGFSWDTFNYMDAIHKQSPDIAQGVNRKSVKKQGAGDQGMMFGYATAETSELMPAPVMLAHGLVQKFAKLRKSKRDFAWLRPDSKCQVSLVYNGLKPVAVDTVVVSHQTTEAAADKKHYGIIEEVARDYFKVSGLELDMDKAKFLVNPTGKFVVGGPAGDSGLTGRKIIVDTYGGVAPHGGGAFSGKDPSKVDRTAAYYARYAAKNIVGAGLAKKCLIQVSYAIGVDKPVSFFVNTFGTAKPGVADEDIEKMLASERVFNFRPWFMVEELDMLSPTKSWQYADTAAYGHFGRNFPWEKLDKYALVADYFGF